MERRVVRSRDAVVVDDSTGFIRGYDHGTEVQYIPSWQLDASGNPAGLVGPDGQDAGVVLAETDPVTGGITLQPHTSTVTSGTSIGTTLGQSVEPTGDGTGIHVGVYHKAEYSGATGVDVTGAGHLVAGLNHVSHAGDGVVASVYPTETKLDVTNGGTVTTALLNEAQVSSNNGTITTLIGHRAAVVSNIGTITNFYGYYFPDHSGISGITNRYAFANLDIGAPVISYASICDASLSSVTPTAGGTTVLAKNISTVLLIPAGTIATHTLTYPTGCAEGQEITFYTTQTITSLLYSAGPAMYGHPTTLTAGSWFTMKYFSTIGGWVRVN